MGRKVSKVFMGLVIMGGIALSILNFVSPLPATQAIWGTTTTPNGPEEWYNLIMRYGPAGLAQRELWAGTFCVLDESNCCIVIG